MPSTRTAGPGRRASSSQRGREGSWQVETGKQPNKRPVLHNQRRAQARRIRQESSNNKTEKAPTALTRHHSTPGSACRQVGQTNQMHKPSGTNAFHACRDAGQRASSSQSGRKGSWQVESGKQPNQRSPLQKQRRAQARRIRPESSNNKTERHQPP